MSKYSFTRHLLTWCIFLNYSYDYTLRDLCLMLLPHSNPELHNTAAFKYCTSWNRGPATHFAHGSTQGVVSLLTVVNWSVSLYLCPDFFIFLFTQHNYLSVYVCMYLHGQCWKNYSDHFIKAATRNFNFVDSGVPCGQKRDKIKVVLVQQCTTDSWIANMSRTP